MKAIINQLAAGAKDLSEIEFREAYQAAHPAPERLGPDNFRQAYSQYKGRVRKAKRRAKGIVSETKNNRHHPERRIA